MRLYLKLATIVLLAVAAQWGLKHGGATASQAWFAARCQLAHMTNDEALRNRLIDEAAECLYPQVGHNFVVSASAAALTPAESFTDESASTAARPDSRPCSTAESHRPCSWRP